MSWMVSQLLPLLLLHVHGVLSTDFDEPTVYTETYTHEGTDFMFFSERITWDEADILCSNYRSRLAVVDNWNTAQFLAENMAYSNMIFDDIWIGGRQVQETWQWVTGKRIPTQTDNEGYPPWVRTQFRSGKNCLVMDRRLHDEPVFADTDCRQMRPFICERSSSLDTGYPVPVKWEEIGNSLYVFYHGRLSWEKAATFCREHGKRLAIVKNEMDTPALLGSAMTLSRPDFENVWIGGYATYGSWIWLATGEDIPEQMDAESKYPPWRNVNTSREQGCLLFDRHECDEPKFVSLNCQRRRDFVCEEFKPPISDHNGKLNTSFKIFDIEYTLFVKHVTWHEAYRLCDEFGGELAILTDRDVMQAIIDEMADHSDEIRHVWIGGTIERGHWIWSPTYQLIPSKVDDFPPWCYDKETQDTTIAQCLNLDRKDHITPMIYGLSCNNTQSYVCKNNKSANYKYDRNKNMRSLSLPSGSVKSDTSTSPMAVSSEKMQLPEESPPNDDNDEDEDEDDVEGDDDKVDDNQKLLNPPNVTNLSSSIFNGTMEDGENINLNEISLNNRTMSTQNGTFLNNITMSTQNGTDSNNTAMPERHSFNLNNITMPRQNVTDLNNLNSQGLNETEKVDEYEIVHKKHIPHDNKLVDIQINTTGNSTTELLNHGIVRNTEPPNLATRFSEVNTTLNETRMMNTFKIKRLLGKDGSRRFMITAHNVKDKKVPVLPVKKQMMKKDKMNEKAKVTISEERLERRRLANQLVREKLEASKLRKGG